MSKIIAFLRLLTHPEDMHKDIDDIDLTKYPGLNIKDLEYGSWKKWAFTTANLITSFFKITSRANSYEEDSFYDRVSMYMVGSAFGPPDYPYDKHLEDVEETIEYIKNRIHISRKIIDFLRLLTDSDDMFKNSDSIDLTKYPALNLEDINEGLWKDWAFKTEDLIISFFSIDGNNRTYENAPFYERTAMYIIGNVFGTPNYPYDKHLEDVRETIEYLKSLN